MRINLLISFLASLMFTTPIIADQPQGEAKGFESIKVSKLGKDKWSKTKIYPVLFSAQHQHQVIAPANGYLTAQELLIGQRVKKGQSLGTLKNEEPGFSPYPISLLSQQPGVLSRMHIPLGSYVRKGDVVFTVLDLGSTIANIQIPQIDLDLVKTGLSGEITVRGHGKFPAQIAAISPVIDLATGTATAQLKYSQKIEILPGTLGQVRIDLASEVGFIIDREATRQLGSKTFVMQVIDEKLVSKEVALDEQRADQILVKSGLEENSLICKKYPLHLKEGQQVRVDL